MHFDLIHEYCMAKPGVEESFPFDNETMVWKIMGKMFCLANINDFKSLNLKCEPERAIELREQYQQITPGWHMNKKLWNTVLLDGLPEKLVFDLIDHSYDEVVRKLPKKVQDTLILL
jgi:predicted DNA-binding protein (MmcQ/YjbR family)